MLREIEMLKESKESIEKVFTQLVGVLSPVFQKLMEDMNCILRNMRLKLSKEYIEAGSPYGENDEGMLRWIKERYEII